jgi:hypothetical protein
VSWSTGAFNPFCNPPGIPYVDWRAGFEGFVARVNGSYDCDNVDVFGNGTTAAAVTFTEQTDTAQDEDWDVTEGGGGSTRRKQLNTY